MPRVVIRSMPNGPNVVFLDGKFVTELCRCGHSQQKPDCDGSHRKAGFVAPAAETIVLE